MTMSLLKLIPTTQKMKIQNKDQQKNKIVNNVNN